MEKVNKIPRRGDSESIKPMKISVMGSLNSSKTEVKSGLNNNLKKDDNNNDNNIINNENNNNNNKDDGDSNDDGENDSNKDEE